MSNIFGQILAKFVFFFTFGDYNRPKDVPKPALLQPASIVNQIAEKLSFSGKDAFGIEIHFG